MADDTFRAAGYGWRLFCGPRVVEASLADAVARAGGRRAFVVCSPSVRRRTEIIRRIEAALGTRYGGVFDAIEKDSTYASVRAATDAARAAGADLLIGVGGGSVLVATRAVAIFMGETGDPFELMTQYPEGRPAFSPRLMAAKPPIINVPTTPTSAMNRAGTGLKNPDLDHRMEYFDPKTRPAALFLDHDALLGTPFGVFRSTATTVFATGLAALAQTGANPLAAADRDAAFRLAHRGYARLADGVAPRMDLALAAFLQNRAADDGATRFRDDVFAGSYAVSTALHVRYPHVGQGEATCVLQAARIRLAQSVDAAAAEAVARALDVWREGMDGRAAALAVADALEAIYLRTGMPVRVRDLGVPRKDLPDVARMTVKNFNANAGVRSPEAQAAEALRLLEAAY